MSTPYHYTPLHEQSHQIRLLTLHPGNSVAQEDSHIRITLEIVQLTTENVPEFEALSYAWGSPENRREVWIVTDSGLQILNITQNLHKSLHHLRYETEPRVLWIDAICINQQDIPERSSQVKRMANIYTLSKRVLVWLGPEADESSLALALLESLGSKIEVDWHRGKMNATSEDPLDRHWADKSQPLPFNYREMTAIVRLCERPWFERLWIWQEIWLAGPSALLVCGSKTLLWAIFCTASLCVNTKQGVIQAFSNRRRILRHLVRKSPYQSFPSLVRNSQWAKCADPRDRIFAVQSLLRPDDPVTEIEPDYTKSAFQIYKEVFLLYSIRQKSLRLLKRCEIAHCRASFPTWLPNWSIPQSAGSTIAQTWASGSSAGYIEQREDNIVRVLGANLDVIQSVARWPRISRKSFGTDFGKMAHHFCVSPTQLEAFCHAIVTGNIGDNANPQSSEEQKGPRLVDLIEFVSNVSTVAEVDYDKLPVRHKTFFHRVKSASRNRAIYKTASGTFGMAPSCAEPGDIVVALLGFDAALILRRDEANTYKVVGESYCYGYMCCEGFLGPLPSPYKMIWVPDAEDPNVYPRYLNMTSGVLGMEDPRFGELPDGWKIDFGKRNFLIFVNKETGKRTEFDPRLRLEALVARGVDIQCFDLI